jgi:hypothetical protein
MGDRVSAEAVARDRESARLRAAARRASQSVSEHEESLRHRRKYEANNREHINSARRTRYGADIDALAARQFIFWDGEGYTTDDGAHHYMLFGCSHFPNDPLIAEDLSTKACLDYLLSVEREYPSAFHVGFAFDYDVNMILGDLPSRCLRHLGDYGVTRWQGYRIAYIPGKMFTVTRGNEKRGEKKVSATIFDVFGFFHSKYTTSLLKFGVATKEELEAVTAGKEERENFTFADIDYVKRYWQEEISYGPVLMDRIRDACYDAGLYVTQWHGPGALAAYMLRKRGVRQWQSKETPHEVSIAIRTAYAGGRFHLFRCGILYNPIYTADINSAYIYACSLLPRMDTGHWRRIVGSVLDRQDLPLFGVYHISFDAGQEKARDNHKRGAFEEIHPLFHRDRSGNLYWPSRTDGWYWGPEARTVAANPNARFLEAWVFDHDGSNPFRWVHDEFDKRLDLQHEGNPAEKTFKWALAAMYGAFARTVGWDRKKKCAPASHELAWAGFITSWCRAEMYQLAYECWRLGGLISIDTDGVTSSVPFKPEWLPRGVGERLGQWKLETFSGILSWQSGFYWLLDEDGKWTTAKTRGLKRGSLAVDAALEAIENAVYKTGEIKPAKIKRTLTRFIGFKEALNRRDGLKSWRKWVQRPMTSIMGHSNTSRHVPQFCRKCRSPEADILHVITHLPPKTYYSQPHKLPWLEPIDELHEMHLIINDLDEADAL